MVNLFKNMPSTAEVDKRALKLSDEFRKHIGECQKTIPDMPIDAIFNGWTFQKLAGLQIAVELLAKDNENLRHIIKLTTARG